MAATGAYAQTGSASSDTQVSAGASVPKPDASKAAAATATPATAVAPVAPPADYLIGPGDVLNIAFWRDKEISGDVIVRPDGKISLPVVNEIQASGLTPDQLRQSVVKASSRLFTEEPVVFVTVRQINSRNVYVIGNVRKPGTYPLLEATTILQLIAKAGGLEDFADKKHIVIVRAEKRPDGENWTLEVSYDDFADRRNLKANVELKPGDTVIVK
jgi:polysaccharide export outer membrane protein